MKTTPTILLALIIVLTLPFGAKAAPDSLVTTEISRLLANNKVGNLHFPKTVSRLYAQNGSQPIWNKLQNDAGQTWQAMLLLDCVIQYGLSAKDYHPNDLTYKRAHALLDTPGKASIAEQALFDILLSDAMLTLINNMHYGKLNPRFTAAILDEAGAPGFRADLVLLRSLTENKSYDFLTAIEKVQPVTRPYQRLQHHMRLLAGVYTGDNYKVPDGAIRLMAINMERLRWLTPITDSNYIEVNIPTYTLQYHLRDTSYKFKVAVGKPDQPTPVLTSKIAYLTIAPDVLIPEKRFREELLPAALKDPSYMKRNHFAIYDKKGRYVPVNANSLSKITQHPDDYIARHASEHDRALGRLVFRFANSYRIDFHDMPKPEFFEPGERALTTGCIWLNDAEKLGGLILENDGQLKEVPALYKAFKRYQRETFVLKQPLAISLIYLTCEVKRGILITYPDIYQLDRALEKLLYPDDQNLSMR